ncbi:hypothetical protein [Microlunatus antarcticus]|uniref:Uncharacterized protein n=1 Tax=Microlunatus antarcticus TaxID=53388 RepID=A0A7W5P9D5_9ACTN|nr:hypothetical protein [Microlunatus antarcticus]MBB3328806.1 hypothetical protein [Microlunatus antarcticus]
MSGRKQDIVEEIASVFGLEAPKMSTGSTEPREIFDLVNRELGLGLPLHLTKPELARAIVESAGDVWLPDYDSRGGTVTLKGLAAVLEAVHFYLGR